MVKRHWLLLTLIALACVAVFYGMWTHDRYSGLLSEDQDRRSRAMEQFLSDMHKSFGKGDLPQVDMYRCVIRDNRPDFSYATMFSMAASLPPDPELVADLTAPRFEITSNGIKITPKDVLVKNLGRSPDKGDAVVMAWSEGHIPTSAVEEAGRPDQYTTGYGRSNGMKVNLGPRRQHHVKGR